MKFKSIGRKMKKKKSEEVSNKKLIHHVFRKFKLLAVQSGNTKYFRRIAITLRELTKLMIGWI